MQSNKTCGIDREVAEVIRLMKEQVITLPEKLVAILMKNPKYRKIKKKLDETNINIDRELGG